MLGVTNSTPRFREIYRFELAYQLRRPWPALFALTLLVVGYLMARDASLANAMFEDFQVNAPFEIAKSTVLGTFLWLLIAAAIAGEAAARDVATRMSPLVYTTPLTRSQYLGGRFLAALTINATLLLLVQGGILLGTYVPALPGAIVGPFRLEAYLTAFCYLSLPNVLFATAIQFALASRTGRPMAAYLGSFLLFFMGFFIATFVRMVIRPKLGMMLDPIGINYVIDGLAHDWTVLEKKVRLIGPEGMVLVNRLFWLAVGSLAFAYAWLRFEFAHRVPSALWRRRKLADGAPPATMRVAPPRIQPVTRTFGFSFQARQTVAIAGTSFRALATSWAGLFLLIVIPLLMVLIVLQQMKALGTPLLPTTALVLREMTAPMQAITGRWVIIPPLLIFFAGELVWRERDAGLGEIADTMPGSEWTGFLGKFLGLSLMIVLLMVLLTVSGVLAQVTQGYHDFELALYVKQLLGLQLAEYLLFALLALVLHVLADQKYLGHLLGMVAYVFIAFLAGVIGVEHNLLIYSGGPGWMYTPMRGFGPYIAPWLWFKLYWAAWALLLAVVARLLWVRGREHRWAMRLRQARGRFTRPTVVAGGLALLLIVSLGGFIFYNTNILNPYTTNAGATERRAAYERRYGRYETVPQPEMSKVQLRLEIHPRQRMLDATGSYTLVNRTARPIDSIHVTTAGRGGITRAVGFDRPARAALLDQDLGYRIYALERPLAPGDSARMTFALHVEPRGFTNRGVDASIAPQASFFTNASWFPAIGFQASRAVISMADRRAAGLAPRPILGALYDEDRDASSQGTGVAFEAVIGTDEGQLGAAPGDLRRRWVENGRQYAEYVTSAPIGDEWAFFSAPFAIREEKWRDVTIRVFHNPAHSRHLDRMLASVRASLEYYSANYGPYRWTHLSILERPGGPGSGAHADPAIIYHGESYWAWTPGEAPGRLDMPYAVLTHEMAHLWPHPYALVEGLPFLGEGLAWYFGMQAIKASRGEEQLRTLLSFMRWPYPFPVIRRGEPLLRAMDPYMAYRKGPMAMYALSELIGADRVNHAIHRMFQRHEAPGAPLATTLDLYRELQAVTPDSLQPLLHDFFEINAFWDLSTERARAVEGAPGTWQVTLLVNARKLAYDTAGMVTELPLDQWLPVGVFGKAEEGHEELSAPLHLAMHRIHSGRDTITITVRGRPELAGIDPRHLFDWEEGEDDNNVEPVLITGAP